MIRTSLLALATVLAAGPALATGEVYCEATDGSGAYFGYTFGRVPGLAVVGAEISADGKLWTMRDVEGATPMILAQGAIFGEQEVIDFADPEYTGILASVRLISATEGDDFVTVGTLRITGVGVFPLVCE